MKEQVILVGNVGGGWSPPITVLPVDPNSWGSRKLEAIKKRRQETGEDLGAAMKWVEENFPEFKV
jgi:hypothetical protein